MNIIASSFLFEKEHYCLAKDKLVRQNKTIQGQNRNFFKFLIFFRKKREVGVIFSAL